MATTYYRFRLDGHLYGLLRRTDDIEGRPIELALVVDGEWVADTALYRYWLDPGDVELVEVDAKDARRAADEMGVSPRERVARTEPVTD